MSDYQRILVVSTRADAAEVARVRAGIGSSAVVITAPTADGKRIVQGLGHTAHPEVVLAPVRFPDVDRGHRLDEVVRRHAVADRFRDVVVVADPSTITLLLRVLAPDQLPTSGPVTEVGLPRGPRPVPLGRAAAAGVALALLVFLLSAVVPVWSLPALAAVVGLGLLTLPTRRWLGLSVLIAVAVALGVSLLAIAGSARFPGAW
ncbi:hypothetical protein IEZ26_01855 [Nocardioides cavernae]|uniref:Uncharacterized protein n=1 Tax=Nocardioides cavernae TaxID=1921566 RepID=A0ABR8N5A9_9ACTN|nr:hypothetical protein [Nocardioides cavernae]MBD3923352.1 hypothetical protein [Nocardioides cavernae]MBM7511725.1 hypothetical protein [Nocardioides cavernae]